MKSCNYFNSHTNHGRADNMARYGYCKAPAITAKDEKAFALAQEKRAAANRKVKITLAATPW